MQMYKVAFQAHWENMTDIGDAIVCADSAEGAVAMVLGAFNLPGSRTTCKPQRIKPSVWLLERKEMRPEKRASLRNLGQAREVRDYNLRVSAVISGTDESHAMRRLAGSLSHKGNNRGSVDTHTKKLMVDCNKIEPEKRALKAMEQVELYKPKTFVGGSEKYANPKK